jgi:hypothetical protein
MKSRYLSIAAIGCAIGVGGFFLLSVQQPGASNTPKQIEVQQITFKGPDGRTCMILDASTGSPVVKFMNKAGKANMQLIGGEMPTISLSNSQQQDVIQITLVDEENSLIGLKDTSGIARLQLQGGNVPAIFLRNQQNEVVATMLTMQDGGAAVGLADKDGDVAAFMRGGSSPSISFYNKSVEPLTAIGISQQVPHLLVTSPTTKDNLVLHGGDPTSVLFVDDKGEIPVLLSKHGLFQGKKQSNSSQSSGDEKIFTWGELLNPLTDIKLNKR